MNKKRALVEIRKLERQINKEYDKFASEYNNENEALAAWNEFYKEDKIRHFIEGFNNIQNNPVLSIGAVYMSIMTLIENKHIKKITIIPNIKYYIDSDNTVFATGRYNIECIWSNCASKHKPYIFWSWIPSKNKPFNKVLDTNQRAYIIPLCEIHSMKVKKNFKLLSDYIKANIQPLTQTFQNKEL
jgi:hypothetical protein